MTSYTEKLNLAKQDTGAQDWGVVLNQNFDKIDAGFGQVGVKNYSGEETYAAGEFVIAVVDDQVGIYKSLQEGNTGHSLSDETWWEVVPLGGGGGLEVCDIGIALGINEAENKRRYLNGQVISQAQFESFTNKLKDIVALYPNLSTTEVNWQAEVTNSKLGQCGKFVIDDVAGTIRLPKVVNINGLQDLTGLGGIKAESLPNITGAFEKDPWPQPNTTTGAFYRTSASLTARASNTAAATGNLIMNLDASLSSSTYQDNAPVQQEAVQYPYFIQVATGSEESIDVSREIELNNPFSLLDYKWSEYELNNASWLISNGQYNSGATYPAVYNLLLAIYNGTTTKAGVSVKLSTEAYADTDFVLNTDDTTFRLPLKVLMAGSKRVAGNGMTLGLTDGTTNYGLGSFNTVGYSGATVYYGADAGTAGGSSVTTLKSMGVTTDPTKSGIETSANGLYLYFYVGETVQDANIIAASQVLTKVANGIDRTVKSDRETVVSWGMPDYSAGVSKTTATTGWTAESDGMVYFRTNNSQNAEASVPYINGTKIGTGAYSGAIQYNTYTFFVSKNDVITYDKTAGEVIFYPCKGV